MTRRATIVGASIAGLLTAVALRNGNSGDSFDEVLLVESDDFPEQPGHRRGVPQDQQVHALLAIGARSMEHLLPGLIDDLVAGGGVMMDAGCEVAIFEADGWAGRVTSEAHVVSMRRTHLEPIVRRRVLELDGITLRHGEVVGLLATADHSRVTGVALAGADTVDSDLVVDASGRGSAAPAWLEALGYEKPHDVELRSYVGYATVPVRLPAGLFPDGVAALLSHPTPDNLYGSSVIPVGDGLHLFGALGMMKCYPPAEREAFLAHMDRSSSPLVAEMAHVAEFVDDIVAYRMPGTRRRMWELLERRPDGFAVVGDAVLSINPLYGQGMSIAAVEAVRIQEVLAEGAGEPSRRIQEAIVPVVDRVFELVVSIDSRYPDAKFIGIERPPDDLLVMAKALSELACEDAEASRAFRYAVQFFANEEMQSQTLFTKVLDWMAEGRKVTNNDPLVVPGILGDAGPARLPTW